MRGPSWGILSKAVALIQEQMDVIKNQERLIKYYEKEMGKKWNITIASNAEKESESPIPPKNTKFVQDA